MKKILVIIFCAAAFLRFWNNSTFPPSLSHDEVAIGYNAYSILKTGKDEYGIFLPMLFRSFDDYKLPGYIYATVISEYLFGFNEFAVRFTSAFLGLLTVIVFYFLVKELFSRNAELIAVIATTILAISPWHVNFSRTAFEANGSLFFIVLGTFLLFKGIKNPKYYIFSSIAFSVSLYFYYTVRIVLPFLLIAFVFSHWREVFSARKWLVWSAIVGFLILLPLLPYMFSAGLSRVDQVSIFQDSTYTNPYSEAIVRNNNSPVSKIMYNRRLAYLHHFSESYLKNFSPEFYFVNGTGPMGLMYLWEIPFFFLGLYIVIRAKEKSKWIILMWFLSVPIAGGLTVQQPNALRTLANVPITSLFTGIGLYSFYTYLQKVKYHKLLFVLTGTIIIFSFLRFLMLYFDYQIHFTASKWGDGHKQMVAFVKENQSEYDAIYITGDFWRPYIYWLFYSQYPPEKYHKNISIKNIDNIYFGRATWDRGNGINFASADLSLLNKGKTLFIMSPSDFTSQKNLYKMKIIKEIPGVIAKKAFYAIELQ